MDSYSKEYYFGPLMFYKAAAKGSKIGCYAHANSIAKEIFFNPLLNTNYKTSKHTLAYFKKAADKGCLKAIAICYCEQDKFDANNQRLLSGYALMGLPFFIRLESNVLAKEHSNIHAALHYAIVGDKEFDENQLKWSKKLSVYIDDITEANTPPHEITPCDMEVVKSLDGVLISETVRNSTFALYGTQDEKEAAIKESCKVNPRYRIVYNECFPQS
ncbi:hypothetical protein FACS1894113_1830 [Alphaproteobacteria bacterium]|nr:hypothetical protein FACS1894113_1830 [Alphaproteobacteria bacterium]